MAQLIITDSTSYLTSEFLQEHKIQTVPLNVNLNGQVFKEGTGMSNHDYFQILRQEPIFPHTSQPSAGDFLAVFSRLQAGDEAVVILISSGISGTVQSALLARTMLKRTDIKIEIIDSLSTSMGLAFQVMKACELREQGYQAENIRVEIIKMQQELNFFFIVDDLEYLARGGRIGHWSMHLGNILQIKPVLHLKDGKIEIFQKIRTRPKAINLIIEEFSKRSSRLEKVGIVHVDDPDRVPEIQARLASIYNDPLIISDIGPVIGSHVGPGTLGLCFY